MQNFVQSIKDFAKNTKDKFKALSKNKKYAIIIGIVAIILAVIFSVSYGIKNKYGILFSGLDSYDAANISKTLEDKSIETKIKGDAIYVPKEQVDKLRLELSPTITNGSKGFELMDEGASLSMTDEEFEIKKLRMLQGELEKTIKTFPQVEDTRVHITQGEESVFSKNSKVGKAAVYVSLKNGRDLDETQIKSIISLVSASGRNIPKQNIEVIDQNMNLLSEGIYDKDGNAVKGMGLAASRNAERELSEELKKSLVEMLEPIFGKNKVKATVNANLNFDTVEKSEIKVDPDKVIKSEIRNENKSNESEQTGSPVDNNMNNTANGENSGSSSKEEKIEYEVGKTETKTITTSGEVKRLTVSVAIDGNLPAAKIASVEKMVASAIGMNTERGDELSVVAMEFNPDANKVFDDKEVAPETMKEKIINIAIIAGTILAILTIALIAYLIYKGKKDKYEVEEEIELEDTNDLIARMVREKEIEKTRELSLEDEIKVIVSQSPEEVTKLIKTWLND